MVPATLAARLHEMRHRRPARACTSAGFLDLPFIEGRSAVLFSSSAKHPDAIHVIKALERSTLASASVITHRDPASLDPVAAPDVKVVQLPPLAQRDGFLATGSVLQMGVMLLRVYHHKPDLPHEMTWHEPEKDLRDELLILAPPSLDAVAADIEVRMAESGLASAQVTDYRNFAHGRHTGLSRRMDEVTIIALSDPSSEALADATVETLPRDADVRRWHSGQRFPGAIVELLIRSISLAGSVGEQNALDVARPKVPAFGRRLYRLPLGRRLPLPAAGGIERKILARGTGDEVQVRRLVAEAASEWLERVLDQRFAGVVMDYDGTVCWTSRRLELPDERIQRKIVNLIGRGAHVAFASGRGQSLHADLRRWVPKELWKSIRVGMYNGSVTLRVDEEMPDQRVQSDWSHDVVSVLKGVGLPPEALIEERTSQVTLATKTGLAMPHQIINEIRECLRESEAQSQVVSSGHSIDIIPAKAGKSAVYDEVAEHAGGPILAIGDSGQCGGNDHALLAGTPWSMSVNNCSGDLTRCWFMGDGRLTGPRLLSVILSALRRRSQGFAAVGIDIA